MNHFHLAIFRHCSMIHTFSPAHSEQAWYWRHTLAQSQLSGMKRSILFSVSNLGFSDGICVWTICTRCQVCIKTSNTPAVLIARLWLVTSAMVKRGQAGDIHWWVLPREIASVCVLWRCALSPLSLPFSLVSEKWATVWTEGECQILLSSSTQEGFGGALAQYSIQHLAFSQSHHLAGLMLIEAEGELNLIIMWLVLSRYNTDLHYIHKV